MGDRIRLARLSAELTDEEKARRSPRQTGPLTQEELAARMGVRRDYLNKMENGGSVGRVNAQRLAAALGGVPDDWLDSGESRTALQREITELKERISALEARLGPAEPPTPPSVAS